jgi:hypothetical protein
MPSGNFYPFGSLSVGTTAAFIEISPANVGGALIGNRGPESVFLGGSTVTADESSTGGMLIAPGEKVTLSTSTSFGDIYAVTAEGTSIVTWIGL